MRCCIIFRGLFRFDFSDGEADEDKTAEYRSCENDDIDDVTEEPYGKVAQTFSDIAEAIEEGISHLGKEAGVLLLGAAHLADAHIDGTEGYAVIIGAFLCSEGGKICLDIEESGADRKGICRG